MSGSTEKRLDDTSFLPSPLYCTCNTHTHTHTKHTVTHWAYNTETGQPLTTHSHDSLFTWLCMCVISLASRVSVVSGMVENTDELWTFLHPSLYLTWGPERERGMRKGERQHGKREERGERETKAQYRVCVRERRDRTEACGSQKIQNNISPITAMTTITRLGDKGQAPNRKYFSKCVYTVFVCVHICVCC